MEGIEMKKKKKVWKEGGNSDSKSERRSEKKHEDVSK
jgi:hypothetical protein